MKHGLDDIMYERVRKDIWIPALLTASLAAAGCSPDSQAGELEAAARDPASQGKVVNVEAQTLEPGEFTSYVRILAEVEAWSDVTVSAQESGVVEAFYMEKGSVVREGQPIAKIDDRVLRALVEEAAAAARLAAWRYERQRQLWEEEKIGSELAYQEAKGNAELSNARLENLEARLERTVIKAPISGVFDQRHVDVGELVNPGMPVGRFVDVSRLKISGGVPERYAAAIQSGDQARVRFEVLSEGSLEGAIGYVGTAVDERNRTFPVEVVIDNPEGIIKPHMVASVEIATDHFDSAMVVPQNAVIRTEYGYQVFVVVDEDGELFARARAIETGPSYANYTVILSGVDFGDRVVVRGQQLVEAGDRVQVVDAERIVTE